MTDPSDKPGRAGSPSPTLFEVLAQLAASGATDADLQRAAETYLLDHQGTWAAHAAVAADLAQRLGVELPDSLARAEQGASAARVNAELATAALVLGRDVLFAAGAYRPPRSDQDADDVAAADEELGGRAEAGDGPDPAAYRELCERLVTALRGGSRR